MQSLIILQCNECVNQTTNVIKELGMISGIKLRYLGLVSQACKVNFCFVVFCLRSSNKTFLKFKQLIYGETYKNELVFQLI